MGDNRQKLIFRQMRKENIVGLCPVAASNPTDLKLKNYETIDPK